MSDPIKPEQGIVAFLDILGYANFLENNEPEIAANTVLKILTEIPNTVMQEHKHHFEDKPTWSIVKKHVEAIKWLVFSDTILMTCPYADNSNNIKKSLYWLYSVSSLRIIFEHLFDNGLPVRGCISFGKFFVKDYCFAGRSIIQAYQNANEIDLSAIIIDKSAEQEMKNITANKTYPNALDANLPVYLVPLKDGDSRKYKVLPPFFRNNYDGRDIKQMVAERFWKHKKDISLEVLNKLNNTEIFFRFMKMKYPKRFEKKSK